MNRDVVCSNQQQFYVLEKQDWVTAKDLQTGDLLASRDGIGRRVTLIEPLATRTKVYHLYLKKNHTFFVGKHGLLAHNMFLPAVQLGLGLAFGSGATAGGLSGGFFGPLALTGSIALGGLAGIALGGLAGIFGKFCFGNRKIPWIELEIDVNTHQHTYDGKQKRSPKKNDKSGKNDNNQNGGPENENDNKKNTDPEKPKDWKPLTNQEARKKAKEMDFQEANGFPHGNSHGQLTFKNKKNDWITPDVDGHKGGVWKLFKSNGERFTLDKYGTKIGK